MAEPLARAPAEFGAGLEHGHPAGHSLFDTSNPARYRASRRVVTVSIVVNALLSAAQIAIGLVGHSVALVADAMHTLADLSTDLMVLFAIKHGAKAADEEHPYGHARIETAMTVALGVVLAAVGTGIAVSSGLRLVDLEHLAVPSAITLWAAGATVLAKEGLYRFTLYTAKRYRSNLLRASAWHHRSDAISSILVLIGIAGSLSGFRYLDALAAVGVGMMIVKIGWDLGWNAIKELIDTALDTEQVAAIRSRILGVDGVKALHHLRTRRTGGQALVDVHILVDGTVSVSEGHHISEKVRTRLLAEFDSITDVLVHIDPEDDQTTWTNAGLPLRHELLERLQQRLAHIAEAREISAVTLHYLGGRVQVEILLPLAALKGGSADELRRRFAEAVGGESAISRLDVHFD